MEGHPNYNGRQIIQKCSISNALDGTEDDMIFEDHNDSDSGSDEDGDGIAAEVALINISGSETEDSADDME